MRLARRQLNPGHSGDLATHRAEFINLRRSAEGHYHSNAWPVAAMAPSRIENVRVRVVRRFDHRQVIAADMIVVERQGITMLEILTVPVVLLEVGRNEPAAGGLVIRLGRRGREEVHEVGPAHRLGAGNLGKTSPPEAYD